MLSAVSTTFIIGPIAQLLGYIINVLYNFLDIIGMPNIVVVIILFTIVVQLLMIPLKYKSQKFTRVSSMLQPEINEIRKKYSGKRDQESMALMNAETNQVYKKYGVSPAGGCLPMLIQMPILFALYAVIQNIPSYIGKVYEMFAQVTNHLGPQSVEMLKQIKPINGLDQIVQSKPMLVDYLYTYNNSNWESLVNNIKDVPNEVVNNILGVTKFLGDVLISDTPWQLLKSHNYIHWIWILPILVYASAYFSMKTVQTSRNDDEENPAAKQMKTMSTIMPIISVVFCLGLPVGLGVYWVVNSLIMGIQQIFMNRYIDNIGIEKIIEKNIEKNKDKVQRNKEKKGVNPSSVQRAATMNTKNIKGSSNVQTNVEEKKNSISSIARLTDKYKDK